MVSLLRITELQKLAGEQALAVLARYAHSHGLDLKEKERRAADALEEARKALAAIVRPEER